MRKQLGSDGSSPPESEDEQRPKKVRRGRADPSAPDADNRRRQSLPTPSLPPLLPPVDGAGSSIHASDTDQEMEVEAAPAVKDKGKSKAGASAPVEDPSKKPEGDESEDEMWFPEDLTVSLGALAEPDWQRQRSTFHFVFPFDESNPHPPPAPEFINHNRPCDKMTQPEWAGFVDGIPKPPKCWLWVGALGEGRRVNRHPQLVHAVVNKILKKPEEDIDHITLFPLDSGYWTLGMLDSPEDVQRVLEEQVVLVKHSRHSRDQWIGLTFRPYHTIPQQRQGVVVRNGATSEENVLKAFEGYALNAPVEAARGKIVREALHSEVMRDRSMAADLKDLLVWFDIPDKSQRKTFVSLKQYDSLSAGKLSWRVMVVPRCNRCLSEGHKQEHCWWFSDGATRTLALEPKMNPAGDTWQPRREETVKSAPKGKSAKAPSARKENGGSADKTAPPKAANPAPPQAGPSKPKKTPRAAAEAANKAPPASAPRDPPAKQPRLTAPPVVQVTSTVEKKKEKRTRKKTREDPAAMEEG